MPLFGKKKDKNTQPETSQYAPSHGAESAESYTGGAASNEPGYPAHPGPGAIHGTGPNTYGAVPLNDPYKRVPEGPYDPGLGHTRASGPGYGSNDQGLAHGGQMGHHSTGNTTSYDSGYGAGRATMGGSRAYKAKSIEKEREAGALRSQGEELAEAERLEREAQNLRRKIDSRGTAGGAYDNAGSTNYGEGRAGDRGRGF